VDIVAKMSDVKSIQDLCKLVVVPLLAAAYISSTGFQIVLEDLVISVPLNGKPAVVWSLFILIFVAKVVWVAFLAFLGGILFVWLELKLLQSTTIFSVVLLCFGFMGIASPTLLPISDFMNPYWYYASIAAGFYAPKIKDDYLGTVIT